VKKSKRKKRDPLKHSDQVRTRREFIDYDYVNQLSKEERDFLAKFTDEYYGGAVKKGDAEALHYSDDKKEYDKLRKDCYNRNNEIGRCQYNLSKTTGKMKEIIECITTIDGLYSGSDYESFNTTINDRLDKATIKSLSDKERKEIAEEIGVTFEELNDKIFKEYLLKQISIFCEDSQNNTSQSK
jgi:hypothetical protein